MSKKLEDLEENVNIEDLEAVLMDDDGILNNYPVGYSSPSTKSSNTFSKYNTVNSELDIAIEKLLNGGNLPENKMLEELYTTPLSIDLVFSSLARKSSLKLMEMENFLSKLEDKVLNDEVLSELNTKELIVLYDVVRESRKESLAFIKDVRENVDYMELQAKVLSAANKKDFEDVGDNSVGDLELKTLLKEMIEKPVVSEAVKNIQKNGLGIDKFNISNEEN